MLTAYNQRLYTVLTKEDYRLSRWSPGVYVAMPAGPVRDASQPIVYVNGKRHELPQGKAETTLLQYLRGRSPFRAATPGVRRF